MSRDMSLGVEFGDKVCGTEHATLGLSRRTWGDFPFLNHELHVGEAGSKIAFGSQG